jgi:hypothetical protein
LRSSSGIKPVKMSQMPSSNMPGLAATFITSSFSRVDGRVPNVG